jgi:FtsZ-binding cell division protein ZapB
MNRYWISAIFFFLVALGIGTWNVYHAYHSTEARKSGKGLSKITPKPVPGVTYPPSKAVEKPTGIKGIPRVRQKVEESQARVIDLLKFEIEELQKENDSLMLKIKEYEDKKKDQENHTKDLLQYVATSVSAVGGIFSIVLGVRKERRESRRRRT